MTKSRISDLKRVIRSRHGVDSHLVSAERIVHPSEGAPIWEGDVLVFRLVDHPVSSKCYVWEMEGELQVVLHRPLYGTPEEAVRGTIGEQGAGSTRVAEIDRLDLEVTLVARVEAKPGMHHLVREELLKLLAPALSEPGCSRFELHQANDDPAIFLFYETWRSEADFERYLGSPQFQAWCVGCEDLVVKRPEISRWHLVG